VGEFFESYPEALHVLVGIAFAVIATGKPGAVQVAQYWMFGGQYPFQESFAAALRVLGLHLGVAGSVFCGHGDTSRLSFAVFREL
jgi:hypothetical protein